METNKLYLAKGTAEVSARGYWFTSGGEKGPFGYYPHLKDEEGKPVFPDTQLHGDLKMASEWLKSLNTGFAPHLAEKVFGKGGKADSALLRITDLELKDSGPGRNFFGIKPRIRIDDDKGTVQKHMLVDRELSFLENQTLEAKVYLGYFQDEEEMEDAKKLLEESAKLLSGFGGFRSRGYGRGDIRLKWDEGETVDIYADSDSNEELPYLLKNLVHFRNKTVDPGTTQRIASLYHITSAQLRGWFANTWNEIYGQWPTFAEMASVTFPTLYPCDGEFLAWPAPMSTLKNERGQVNDMRGKKDTNQKIGEDEENFFSTKTKGLGSGYFVSNKPAVSAKVKTEYRIRNSIDELFVTVENGLFVQELVKKGTCFSGIIRFADPESDFAQKARFILKNVKPLIKGALFEPLDIQFNFPDSPANAESFLVIEPIPFEKSFFSEKEGEKTDSENNDSNQIFLNSARGFNTMLGRPRRNRIVIAPSSVLNKEVENYTVPWAGFGQENISMQGKEEDKESVPDTIRKRVKSRLTKEKIITRTQAGLLREYLHPGQKKEQILQNLNDRIEKYGAKSQESVKTLLTEIRIKLESEEGTKAMESFIKDYLEELGIYLFDNPNAGE